MREEQLHPVAGMMIDAYLAVDEYRHSFTEAYGLPPTLVAKVQHMRSIMQARLNDDGRYVLHPKYAEFGRVQFTDREHDQVFLLRSQAAVTIERGKHQLHLFDPNSAEHLKSDVLMVVYEFESDALSLSMTGTWHAADRTRLEPTGVPAFVARWPFTPTEIPPFDQSERDDLFGELEDDGESEADSS
jgi:hypothetical protein